MRNVVRHEAVNYLNSLRRTYYPLRTVIRPHISAFYGIVIYMYWRDHPPPHFHAIYAEHEAEVSIDPLEIIDGSLPRRARRLVLEWARQHREELIANWERARTDQPLIPIEPLD